MNARTAIRFLCGAKTYYRALSPIGGDIATTIIHSSKTQIELLERLARIAASSAEILITGPSGVGKELYAAYAHSKSPRRDKPFVAVNCANLSGEMIENEIFGRAKGAFTSLSGSMWRLYSITVSRMISGLVLT